jgi:hypothetical protein
MKAVILQQQWYLKAVMTVLQQAMLYLVDGCTYYSKHVVLLHRQRTKGCDGCITASNAVLR